MTEDWWLLLILLMAQTSGSPEDRIEQVRNLFQEEIHEKEVQDHCEYIIWEQDMGSHIPFCKLTGEICDLHYMIGDEIWHQTSFTIQ